MKTKKPLFVLTAVLILLLAACTTDTTLPGTGDGQTPAAPDQLPGPVMDAQNWLSDMLGFPVDQVEIVDFNQEEWTDSCLGLGGPAESCLTVITPGWRVNLLVAGEPFEVRTDEEGTVFRSPQISGAPGAPTSLAGTQWNLSSFSESGIDTPVVAGTEPTLEFQEGGQAVGMGGCNQFGAQYSTSDNQLDIIEIITTEIACLEEGVMEQEQRYYQALQSADDFELLDSELRINYGGGQGMLIFTRAG